MTLRADQISHPDVAGDPSPASVAPTKDSQWRRELALREAISAGTFDMSDRAIISRASAFDAFLEAGTVPEEPKPAPAPPTGAQAFILGEDGNPDTVL